MVKGRLLGVSKGGFRILRYGAGSALGEVFFNAVKWRRVGGFGPIS